MQVLAQSPGPALLLFGVQQGPPGPPGPSATGKSAYQSYLDTTADDPVLTESEWAAMAASPVTVNEVATDPSSVVSLRGKGELLQLGVYTAGGSNTTQLFLNVGGLSHGAAWQRVYLHEAVVPFSASTPSEDLVFVLHTLAHHLNGSFTSDSFLIPVGIYQARLASTTIPAPNDSYILHMARNDLGVGVYMSEAANPAAGALAGYNLFDISSEMTLYATYADSPHLQEATFMLAIASHDGLPWAIYGNAPIYTHGTEVKLRLTLTPHG